MSENATIARPSGRSAAQCRPIELVTGFTRHAEGSVLIRLGETHVLCNASVLDKVPPFLKGKEQGWVTAEYGMLPRSTHTRSDREAARGKQNGRTQEIQRLIGRSLRAVFDLKALGERTIHIDCDVLQADGGTRCASRSSRSTVLKERPRRFAGGAFPVALQQALATVADTLGATPDQVALAWLRRLPGAPVPIIGSLRWSRIENALAGAQLHLDTPTWFHLAQVARGYEAP